jgi:hypothetical protein
MIDLFLYVDGIPSFRFMCTPHAINPKMTDVSSLYKRYWLRCSHSTKATAVLITMETAKVMGEHGHDRKLP